MRIVCISDLHNQLSKITLPSADLLIIAGDLTVRGSIAEFSKFNEDIGAIKNLYSKGIVVINGNHDGLGEENRALANSILTNVSHYIQDELIEIDGVKIYGSAWTPEFGGWWFSKSRGANIKEVWDKIPVCDVLITHGPPYGILDEADIFSGHLGDADLLEAVLRAKPKIHCFGHIHGGHGVKEFNGTTFINAASCNEMYRPVNLPIEIEI